MNEILRKYWWVIVVAFAAPIILNFALLCPAITPIVGDNIEWLSFWGGYLGAIISSSMSFIILAIQYRQNHSENEKNRKLQIAILEYQQETQWLNLLRKACADFLGTMTRNEYIEIAQKLKTNPKEAFLLTRRPYDIVGETATAIGVLCYKSTPSVIKIDKTRSSAVEAHRVIMKDVVALTQYYTFDFNQLVAAVNSSPNTSNQLKEIVNNHTPIEGQQNILDFLSECIMIRIREIPNYANIANISFSQCLAMEQSRIDNILNACNHEK